MKGNYRPGDIIRDGEGDIGIIVRYNEEFSAGSGCHYYDVYYSTIIIDQQNEDWNDTIIIRDISFVEVLVPAGQAVVEDM